MSAVIVRPRTVSLGATGVILSAAYALYLYRRVIFGVLEKPALLTIEDLTFREQLCLVPLLLLTIYYGVHPQPILDASAASVEQMLQGIQHAAAAMRTAGL